MPSPASNASAQTFHCPSCGASLAVPEDGSSAIRCAYCGSNVLVPAEFRQTEQEEQEEARQPLVIVLSEVEESQTAGESPAVQVRSLTWVIGVLMLICVVIGVITAVLASAGAFATATVVDRSINQAINQGATLPAIPTEFAQLLFTATPSANPDYSIELQFGLQGSGPGQFDDARFLAVDPGGNIFTAEFQDGRLQKFDPSGQFLQLTNVPPDKSDYTTISDLASDYGGRLLAARRGDILIFNGADGSLLDTIPGKFAETWYEALAVDPANMLYALHTAAGELDLIKLDPSGQLVWRKPQVNKGLVQNTQISSVHRLAVDGLGNSFLLDDAQNQVYQFDAQGNFVDRFGSKGNGPGLLDNPEDLAVDGQGRVYILDQDGIEIFDQDGAHLKLIPDEYQGHAFDIKLDLQGNVYIITNASRVYKLKVNLGE